MRALSTVGLSGLLACTPAALQENWTCDFDATESRPLDQPDAPFDEAGTLPPARCMATCGPPASACKYTLLDGSKAGAICPVCTF